MKIKFLTVMILALVAGCGKHTDATPNQPSLRTDVSPIELRLPKLGRLQAVWWQSLEITKKSFLSPPGNPVYRLRGLAKLGKTQAEEYFHSYMWEKMPVDWKPGISVSGLNLSGWSRNNVFTQEHKPQKIPGSLYFEPSSGIVYFDIEVEK